MDQRMLSGNLLIHDLGLQPADKPDDGSAFSCRNLERCKRNLNMTDMPANHRR